MDLKDHAEVMGIEGREALAAGKAVIRQYRKEKLQYAMTDAAIEYILDLEERLDALEDL